MQPLTKSDLKELMMELRESMKASIREAVAAGFGNSKPALEQATATSQLLAMDASDAKVPAPACSSPDQGTSGPYLALTATIHIVPELDVDATGVAAPTPTTCLTDGLNHNADGDDHMAAWQAAWSTPMSFTVPPGDSPTPSREPALVLALHALAHAKCSTEGSEVIANSVVPASMCGVARSATVTTLYTAASTLHHWLQRVPPWPPDQWNFFWGKHGFLLSANNNLDAQMCPGPNESLCRVGKSKEVNDLLEASKTISTLPSMVELDIQKGTVRHPGSQTRNLLRVKRGIDMVKVLFEQILVTEGNSLKDAASKAYAQVLAPHHGWAIRKAVGAGMYALPSKSQLLKKLNEDENSARAQMQSFVRSSGPVILYVEDLFTSRNLGLDW